MVKPLLRYPLLFAALALFSLAGIVYGGIDITHIRFPASQSDMGSEMNAPYTSVVDGREKRIIVIDFDYKDYESPYLSISPIGCLDSGFSLNEAPGKFPRGTKLCTGAVIKLGKGLQPGHNTLTLFISPKNVTSFAHPEGIYLMGLAVTSPPLGVCMWQSLCSLLFIGSLLALLYRALIALGHDRITCGIITVACAFYAEWLHFTGHFFYTNDLGWHIAYIQYVSDHFLSPYGYNGNEHWHPPLYYWICAIIARLAAATGSLDVWTGIRLFSLSCYVVFIYYSMRCFKLLLRPPYYYLALLLFVFWPSGFNQATRINNDIPYYACYSACFYYLLSWYGSMRHKELSFSIIACALAFMVKSAALVLLALMLICVAGNLCRRKIDRRYFWNRALWPAYCIFALALLFNLGKPLYLYFALGQIAGEHLGTIGQFSVHFRQLIGFSISSMIKVPIGPSWDGTLWNYMARTSLFTENHWQGRWLALCLEWLQLSLVIFVCCCAFMLRRSHIVRYLPLFAGVILPFIALSIFSVYFNYVSNFNLRYIQPVLTGVIALYMLGVQKAADRDLIIVSSIGEGLAIAFCIISVIFYQLQLWFY